MTMTTSTEPAATTEASTAIENSISIDIGGTFTDCFVAYHGKTASGKAPTTRHRLSVGFDGAIADCADHLGVSAAGRRLL